VPDSALRKAAWELHPLDYAPRCGEVLMPQAATVGTEQQQHLQALEYANRVRLARARMKRRIAAGELSAAEVVVTCPWQAQSMSVSDLLMSQKRWGRARCRRLLVSLGVPENKQMGTLTERQRLALLAVLEEKGGSGGESVPSPPQGAFQEHALSAA
jgi:hypothetical protein